MAAFKPGHPKYGGRHRGTRDKADVAREQLMAETFRAMGLRPEEVEALSPLAVMKLVMHLRLKAGDHAGALIAAEMAAPYTHARLTNAQVQVSDARMREWARMEAMSDEEMANEIAEIEQRMKECDESDEFLRKLEKARLARGLNPEPPVN